MFNPNKFKGLMNARRKNKNIDPNDEDKIELEKNDLLAMIIAAFITLWPALIITIGMILFAYWFMIR